MRNMTGSPIAGIDPHEFLDVRQLNKREPNPCQMSMYRCNSPLLPRWQAVALCSLMCSVIACIINRMTCSCKRSFASLPLLCRQQLPLLLCVVVPCHSSFHTATALSSGTCAPCRRRLEQQLFSCLCSVAGVSSQPLPSFTAAEVMT